MSSAHLAANAIRVLAMDSIQKSNSGHPGAPMGMADMAVVLWSKFLKVDPTQPNWANRDRFVLSNGHASMLMYSLLHLSGFPLPMAELATFRQWGSHTAGHPEVNHNLGIEVTTGPLGAGFSNGVGMAIAERHLNSVFGDLVDHTTYAFVSDGDLMEGISQEAGSLAGHLGLGKLIYLYDSNKISIDGSTEVTFTEDTAAKYAAMGWHTTTIDGHDHDAIEAALTEAKSISDRPSLIVAQTHIGYGSPNKVDTSNIHGSPLGADEVALTKEALGWKHAPFEIPAEVYAFFSDAMASGTAAREEWDTKRVAAFAADPSLAARWGAHHSPVSIALDDPGFDAPIATRSASGKLFDQIADKVPGFMGGSADLIASTKTIISTSPAFSSDSPEGRNIYFGIREHAMGGIVNGITVHGGLRGYGSTFFVFSDYMRGAIRLSALMGLPSIWVFTHDSYAVGEDGPTHQPIEQLAAMRVIPNMVTLRPADATETIEAWEIALNRNDGPTTLLLTRQNLPVLERSRGGVARGAYVLRDGSDITLIATGSEVSAALGAADLLAERDVSAKVVSMPSWELFAEQPAEYRTEILGNAPRVAIEAGTSFGWERWVGDTGLIIGIDHFGKSAPAERLAEEFGFTPEAIVEQIATYLP
jgi:transketolase